MKEQIWDGEFGAVGLDKVATFDMLLQFQGRNCGVDAGRFSDWVGQEGLGVLVATFTLVFATLRALVIR